MTKLNEVIKKTPVLVCWVILLASSCKEYEYDKLSLPVLTTSSITIITQTTAISGGIITSDGGSMITSRGVCWSNNPNPLSANSKTLDGTGKGAYTSFITGLNPNTSYYVWAYATNKTGTAYGNPNVFSTANTVIDFDGNMYDTVQIGMQIWMKQNLKVTHYRNGDPISRNYNCSFAAYYDHDNNPDTSKIYGRLYNWYAVNDSRNIAPIGWHVASDAEWTTLINFLGGEYLAGGKLKESGTWHWVKPNIYATNESGFTALPGGSTDGVALGHNGLWWTSDSSSSGSAWSFSMSHLNSDAYRFFRNKYIGLSVRCVKN